MYEWKECVFCYNGSMEPDKMIYVKNYNGVELTIKNIPIFKCQNEDCKESTIGTGSFLKALRSAVEQYDKNGETVYTYPG